VVATASPRDHQLTHQLGAAVVIDQTVPDWPDRVRETTDGGADKILACTASVAAGAARAARDEGQPSGSRLIRMAPWFDDGTHLTGPAGLTEVRIRACARARRPRPLPAMPAADSTHSRASTIEQPSTARKLPT
jgi:threonine dehydrogenase-like Zn-dependent dehydrogenase